MGKDSGNLELLKRITDAETQLGEIKDILDALKSNLNSLKVYDVTIYANKTTILKASDQSSFVGLLLLRGGFGSGDGLYLLSGYGPPTAARYNNRYLTGGSNSYITISVKENVGFSIANSWTQSYNGYFIVFGYVPEFITEQE